MHSSLLSWRDHYLKNSKIYAKMPKIKDPRKKKIAYMNHIKMRLCHTSVIFTPKHMKLQRQQCVHTHSRIMCYHTGNVYLRCCAQSPIINLPDQETYDQYPDTISSIRFHIYHIIALCEKHGRIPLTDKKICRKCQ